MELLRSCGFFLIALVLISLLKQYQPTYGLIAVLASMALVCTAALGWALPFFQWMESVAALADIQGLGSVMKAAGIVLLTRCIQELCKDAGQNALAMAADLVGRCMVLAAAMPMMQKVMDVLMRLLQ